MVRIAALAAAPFPLHPPAQAPSVPARRGVVLFGLPKGRFGERARLLLKLLGADSSNERLRIDLTEAGATAFLLRAADIPAAVSSGYLDAGIAPDEWLLEWEAQHPGHVDRIVSAPPWLRTRLSFFGPLGSNWPPDRRTSIATIFPFLARSYLSCLGCTAEIVHVSGSTEALVGPLAALGFDCVETGATLARHALVEIATPYPRLAVTLIARQQRTRALSRFLVQLTTALGQMTVDPVA